MARVRKPTRKFSDRYSAGPPLYRFQEDAVKFLSKTPKAYLTAKMGLGKTVIAIETMIEGPYLPALIICPSIVKYHWAREISRWSRLKPYVCEKNLPAGLYDVQIISYEQAQKIPKDMNSRFKMVIFDEAHFLKSKDAQRTASLILEAGSFGRVVPRQLYLSGTPAPNNASELWPVFYTIGATSHRWTVFTEKHCTFERVYVGNGKFVNRITGTRPESIAELKAAMKNCVYQITYDDAKIELPRVVVSELPLSASDVLRPRPGYLDYDVEETTDEMEFVEVFSARLEAGGDIAELLVENPSFAALRREHALKKSRSVATLIVSELEAGLYKRIVVFGHHTGPLDKMKEQLDEAGIPSAVIHGEVHEKDRASRIEDFMLGGEIRKNAPRVLLCSIGVAAVGINLQIANHMIFLEQSYVPANNAQAIARCARIGQEQPFVFVRLATLEGSYVDKRVTEILHRKTMEMEGLFRGGNVNERKKR